MAEAVCADGSMEDSNKEEITTTEIEQRESNEGESCVDMTSNSLTKRGRGRPQGSKKLKVSVTDVSLTELGSGISDGGSTEPHGGTGSPKLSDTEKTEQPVSGEDSADKSVETPRGRGRPKMSKKTASNDTISTINDSPKKRGRPKKSLDKKSLEQAEVEDLQNGDTDVPKKGRGRSKGSTKRKSESLTSGEENEGSSATPRKRGRPKGPVTDGSQPAKRGRGRPKGFLNKKPAAYRMHRNVGQKGRDQPAEKKRGRPRKQPGKSGRPRKYPLPSPEELKKPKVWKPLGRPRKYPRVDPPEGAPPAPVRGRGRPPKSASRKGAHLRKSFPAAPTLPPNGGTPGKRGRPLTAAKSPGATPGKRGRPKGSPKKNKARSEKQIKSTHPATEEDEEETVEQPEGDAEESQA